MLGGMNHEGPIITNYSPISSKGGAKKRKTRTRKTRKTRRPLRTRKTRRPLRTRSHR
jgi:hypothetical protein